MTIFHRMLSSIEITNSNFKSLKREKNKAGLSPEIRVNYQLVYNVSVKFSICTFCHKNSASKREVDSLGKSGAYTYE